MPFLGVLAAVALALASGNRSFSNRERLGLWLALGAHSVAAIAQVEIVTRVYGGGDILAYHRQGVMLADLLRTDPAETSWLMLQKLFHRESVPLPVPMGGESTGAMTAFVGFCMVPVNDSLYAGCMLFAGLAFLGKVAAYWVLKQEFAPAHWRRLRVGVLWIPSVVFWSSGMLKESLAITGISIVLTGGFLLARKRRLASGLAWLLLGTLATGIVKPYLLVPLAIAAAAWVYFDGARPHEERRHRRLRLNVSLLALAMGIGCILLVGKAFPKLSPENVAVEAFRMQQLVEVTEGHSDYTIGTPAEGSLRQQVAMMPLALATALFRPLPTEANNALLAASAVETLLTTLMLLWLVVSRNPLKTIARVIESPALVFLLVFSLGVGLGVGMGSTNLGTLSRYRMPFIPFYTAALLVLISRKHAWIQAASSRLR